MATPDHLLKDWDGFLAGAVLRSFNDNAEKDHAIENSFHYHVDDWRTEKPVFNEEFCIHCQFCWVFCPDTSIISKDKKFSHVDYDHCKGCGICVEVCPTNPKSLLMFNEQMSEEKALACWPAKEKKETEGEEK
jgi:pyruvate ferredoxin oxidoreductase delta subunit